MTMKLTQALLERRAVRDFLPDPVPREVLLELVKSATTAPSHLNLQPWAFSVTDDPDTVAQLSRRAQSHLVGTMPNSSPFFTERERLRARDYELFYNAPALIVLCATQPGHLADAGCAMAAHAMMLSAHALGLGTCWVSMALPWMETADGREALNIPRDYRPLAPIIVGCPSGAPRSPGRFEPIVRWMPALPAR